MKFGPQTARKLNRRKLPASPRGHLDEMVSTIGGERMYIGRAVDDEGEVLDFIVQKRRDGAAAQRLRHLISRLTLRIFRERSAQAWAVAAA